MCQSFFLSCPVYDEQLDQILLSYYASVKMVHKYLNCISINTWEYELNRESFIDFYTVISQLDVCFKKRITKIFDFCPRMFIE